MSIWTAEEAVLLLTGESSLLPMVGAGVLAIVILGVDGKSQGSHPMGMAARMGSRGEEAVVEKSLVVPHVEQVGRVVVITGAGRGIDQKTARVLAHLGAYVAMAAIHDRDPLAGISLAAGDGKALSFRSEAVEMDSPGARTCPHLLGCSPSDALNGLAVFSTSRRHLERAVHERYRILTGDLRREFRRMRELLHEMLQLDGGVMISMETVRDDSLVRS